MLTHERLAQIERIINYLRKSRKDEELEKTTGEDTLALHEKIMNEALAPLGIPFDTAKEIVSGETIEGRPEFVKIIKWLEEGRYQAIAVKEISRLGRGDMKDMGAVLDVLKDREILIITPDRIYDVANSNDDYDFVSFAMFINHFELRFIVRRLVSARKERAREGRWMATIPYGYNRDKASKRLVLNEEEAKIVKLIFDWYVYEGVGMRVIANRLTAMQTPASHNGSYKKVLGDTDWEESSIGNMLENTVYIGVSKFGTTKWKGRQKKAVPLDEKLHILIENAHPAIVSKEVFEIAQQIRKGRTCFPKNQLSNPNYEPYELTGLLVCPECRKHMVITKYEKKYKNGTVGIIKRIACKKGCHYVKYEPVLEQVEGLLRQFKTFQYAEAQKYFGQYETVKNTTEKERERTKQFTEQNYDERISKLKHELVSNARRIDIIGEEIYLSLKAQVEAEILALEELKKSTEEASATVSQEKERTTAIIDLADFYFKQCKTRTQKQKVMSAIFHHIELKVLERGSKAHPAKIEMTPYLKFHINLPVKK